MGSVEKRVRDGNVSYLARWRDDTNRQRSKSFRKKGDADRFLSGIESDLNTGRYVDPHDKTTVTEYARRYAATRTLKPRTRERVASLIDCHIDGTPLGARRLASVRPSEVQGWVTGRAELLAPSTLRYLVSFLRSVYGSAVLDRLVATSPVIRITLPSQVRERVVPLTVAQVQALADAVPTRYRAMVITQAGLGLRIGELLGLRAGDVDFEARTVRVESQIDPKARERIAPKTPRSRRTIPLPLPVAVALAEHLEAFPAGDDGSLFTTRFGRPYRHDWYGARVFKDGVKAAGLPPSTTPHDLRHHYASVLLLAGESVVAVAERLGHENASLVLSTYGHLMPDSDDRTRKAIETAWGVTDVEPDQPDPS